MSTPIDRIRAKVNIIPEMQLGTQGTEEIVSMIKRLYNRHSLVPVICEDMYEYRDPDTGIAQSLHSYLVEKVIAKQSRQLCVTEKELNDIVEEGYYGISLLGAKVGREIFEDLFSSIIDEDNVLNAGAGLKPEVKAFLKACDFPLIVTTSCFPILEKELGTSYSTYWNELEIKNDSPLPKKCIYHLFGEAKPENSNWGYNDKQLLRFLKAAYSDYPLKNLTSVIGNNSSRQTLLILGNDAPDWLFRFILTPIYGGDVYDDGKGFYMSENTNVTGSLSLFLEDIKFEKESQLIEVLENVTIKVSEKRDSTSEPNSKKTYDLFVSHAGEDTEVAKKLVERLRANGLSVWVDYENIKDGKYWQRIIDALRDSTYFMPFITGNFILKTVRYDTICILPPKIEQFCH